MSVALKLGSRHKRGFRSMTTRALPLGKLGVKKIAEAEGIVEYRLKNGLKILLRENRSAPVVSFMIVYRVGSRNEAVGHTGSTHFLEHMMFKGTPKFNPAKGNGVMEILARIGALRNATTWLDRTNYFECAGSEYLELCIQIEADRMRNLNLREEDRVSEMTVVRNEFERGENNPGSALYKEVIALAFREHPYHHPTIGWRSDVEGVPLTRMREFYDTYYWPDNATVIAVGDFESENALRLIHKYFGGISRAPGKIPEVYTVEPPQEGERRVEVCRAGDLPQLMIGYHTPQADHPDTYPLAVMHSILGDSGKRSSRLYRALMETGLATSCYSGNGEFRDPFLFSLGATLAPGKTFAEVEQAIYAELEKMAREPVTADELDRARKSNRKGTTLAGADPQTFANMLCTAESVADWQWLVNYDDKFEAVTPEDIMRVSKLYFERSNRTVGHFIPTDRNGTPPNFAAPAVELKIAPSKSKGKAPTKQTAPTRRLNLPRPGSNGSNFAEQVTRVVLPNGLTILAMSTPNTGSVSFYGTLAAGDCFAQPEKSLIPTVTSTMLTRGSTSYSKEQLAKVLEEMGVRFGFGTDRFKTEFGTLVTREDFPEFVKLVSDVVRRPAFPAHELPQVLREMRAGLTRRMNDTGSKADNALMQALYPASHPFYEKPIEDQVSELDQISVNDLETYHKEHYSPKGTILTVVGDIDPDEAIALVQSAFGDWLGAERKMLSVPIVELPDAARMLKVNLNDKANVDILIGHPTELKRSNKDFFAAQLANAVLGKDTISARLGKLIRVKHGLTYGVYSYFDDASFGAAPWLISLSVNPANVSRSLELVKQVLDDVMKKGITEEELADEAGRAVGGFVVSLRSSDGIAAALSRFEFIGLGVAALDSVASEYMAVTRKDVIAAIRKYFHPDKAVTVLSGTVDKIV